MTCGEAVNGRRVTRGGAVNGRRARVGGLRKVVWLWALLAKTPARTYVFRFKQLHPLIVLAVAASSVADELPTSELAGTADSGLPPWVEEEDVWVAARGRAEVVEREDGIDTIIVTAQGLVRDGIHTIWWVNPRVIGMDMGPGGGLPQNTFTADHQGKARTRLTVSSDNDYQLMGIAYHAVHRLYGEEPGEMGGSDLRTPEGPVARSGRPGALRNEASPGLPAGGAAILQRRLHSLRISRQPRSQAKRNEPTSPSQKTPTTASARTSRNLRFHCLSHTS